MILSYATSLAAIIASAICFAIIASMYWKSPSGPLTFKRRIISHPLKTIFQHKACTNKLYADSFYKVQKNSHSSFEVICCRS